MGIPPMKIMGTSNNSFVINASFILNKIANRNLQIKKKNVSGLFSLLSLF
jgi:hypothetical protein